MDEKTNGNGTLVVMRSGGVKVFWEGELKLHLIEDFR